LFAQYLKAKQIPGCGWFASHPAQAFHRILKQMLSAIEEGGHTRGVTERMRELEVREDVL
jgi:site-specific DNA recombinase